MNDARKNWLHRLHDWRKEHMSERMFMIILALIVGFLSAVAAFVLHGIINLIVALLTGQFASDAANWLWSAETTNEKIRDVILEYKIIEKTNELLQQNAPSLKEAENAWRRFAQSLRIPLNALGSCIEPGLDKLLQELSLLCSARSIQEQRKTGFLSLLETEGQALMAFRKEQENIFLNVFSLYLEGLTEDGREKVYREISSDAGAFLKNSGDFIKYTLEPAIQKV